MSSIQHKKYEKLFIKTAQIRSAHLQYVRFRAHSLDKKKCKLLELQITLCKHPKSGVDVIMSKFNSPKI